MISIRNAKHAKSGLRDMIDYIDRRSKKQVSEMTLVELGSYVGDSSQIFAERFERIFCVDPWENGYDDNDAASYQHDMSLIESEFDKNMSLFDNVTKLKMKSSVAVAAFAKHSMDVIYIDALHTYIGVRDDIALYYDIIRPGGWLCGHDYQGRFPGVIKAVNEFREPDKTFQDTSWCIRLNG